MPEQVKLYFLRSKKKQETDKRKSYQMTHCLKTFTEAINSSYLMEIRLRWDIFRRYSKRNADDFQPKNFRTI